LVSVGALRAPVAQQRKVVQAYQVRDARMAALLRSLGYAHRGGPGGGGFGMPSARMAALLRSLAYARGGGSPASVWFGMLSGGGGFGGTSVGMGGSPFSLPAMSGLAGRTALTNRRGHAPVSNAAQIVLGRVRFVTTGPREAASRRCATSVRRSMPVG
jgi:hypothetical protein